MMIPARRQSGLILLGLMLMIMLASGYYLLGSSNQFAIGRQRDAKTMGVLLEARDALIARAVLDTERPGSLPCPDIATNIPGNNIPGDGKADLLAGNDCPSYAGWLPWRTLDLNDPRDASGDRLWYVLSPNFRDSDSVTINTSTTATLNLDDQSGIVALIIAPGGALGGQNRPSNSIADYLDDLNGDPETSNRDGDNNYFSVPVGDSFNDRVITIDRVTLFNAVATRLLGEIRHAVNAAGASLPFADSNGNGLADAPTVSGGFPYLEASYDLPSPTWPAIRWYDAIATNGWFPQINYNRTAGTVTLGDRTVSLP